MTTNYDTDPMTERSPMVVEAMEFIGERGLGNHKASVLTARARENGAACLTLDFVCNGTDQTWSIELTYEQRCALSRLLDRHHPRLYRVVDKP